MKNIRKFLFFILFGLPLISTFVPKENKKEHSQEAPSKMIKNGYTEKIIDSFFRYEIINFVTKSNNALQSPPEKFTKKLIDQSLKMYPNSMHLQQDFFRKGVDYYLNTYPYIYEVKIKELDFGKKDDNTFYLSINLFRNFDDGEVRAILSEELKFFAKQSTAQVIDGFAKIDNETYMKFDGVNSLYYVRDLDKVINAKEYTGFKIEKSPQGQTLNPIFESIIFEKNSQDFFRCIGKTNLPDNFSLSISLFKLGKYEKGLKCEVKNNGLVSEWFKLEDLLANTYDFEITSPMACIQPKCIQTIIGECGQNLKGPNVEVSTFGMCNSIRFKGKIVVKLIE